MTATNLVPKFQSGGALGEGVLYVKRAADGQLLSALSKGEYCSVLAPRQMGKSSLRVRVVGLLRQQGVRCVSIDLSGLGTGEAVTAENWYFSIIEDIAEQLDLSDVREFWQQHQDLTIEKRWHRFLSNMILRSIEGPIVIFLDEIETLLNTKVDRSSFFASIRALYNERGSNSEYLRLTFCLIGVATPSELIADRDARLTPFNIGATITLEDFTVREAQEFRAGLEAVASAPQALLNQILAWTDGHPYMTHRLCSAVVERQMEGKPAGAKTQLQREVGTSLVRELVDELFLQKGRVQEVSLAYAERRFTTDELYDGSAPDQAGDGDAKDSGQSRAIGARADEKLRLYGALLRNELIPFDHKNPVHHAMVLSGVVKVRGEVDSDKRFLRIRNLIFERVFDSEWLYDNEYYRRMPDLVRRWTTAGRDARYLLSGEELRKFGERAKKLKPSPDELELINASLSASAGRLKIIVPVAAFIIVILGGLIGWTITNYVKARELENRVTIQVIQKTESLNNANLNLLQQKAQLINALNATKASLDDISKKSKQLQSASEEKYNILFAQKATCEQTKGSCEIRLAQEITEKDNLLIERKKTADNCRDCTARSAEYERKIQSLSSANNSNLQLLDSFVESALRSSNIRLAAYKEGLRRKSNACTPKDSPACREIDEQIQALQKNDPLRLPGSCRSIKSTNLLPIGTITFAPNDYSISAEQITFLRNAWPSWLLQRNKKLRLEGFTATSESKAQGGYYMLSWKRIYNVSTTLISLGVQPTRLAGEAIGVDCMASTQLNSGRVEVYLEPG